MCVFFLLFPVCFRRIKSPKICYLFNSPNSSNRLAYSFPMFPRRRSCHSSLNLPRTPALCSQSARSSLLGHSTSRQARRRLVCFCFSVSVDLPVIKRGEGQTINLFRFKFIMYIFVMYQCLSNSISIIRRKKKKRSSGKKDK